MGVHAGVGSLWTPENSRISGTQPPAAAMRDSKALRSALLLHLLPALLLLSSATSSSCSLPAISKTPSRRERYLLNSGDRLRLRTLDPPPPPEHVSYTGT